MATSKSADMSEDVVEGCKDSKRQPKNKRHRKSSGKAAAPCNASEEREDKSVATPDQERQPVSHGARKGPASKDEAKASESKKAEYCQQIVTEEMLEFIGVKFPGLHSSTYFVPSIQFNRTLSTDHPHHNIEVQQKSDISDTGSDRAESDVMRCLRHIADVTKTDPMFVLFNYAFDNYLQKPICQPCQKPSDAASANTSSRSKVDKSTKRDFRKQKAKDLFHTPDELNSEYRRGDFDTLLVSPKHGFIVIETKAVGYNEEQKSDVLKEKAFFAISQLNKSETVLRFLFSDLLDNVVVTKVLALPNVTRTQIKKMLYDSPDMAKDICRCVQVDLSDQAAQKVLCADDLVGLPDEGKPLRSESGAVTPHGPLLEWWKHVTTALDTRETSHDGAEGNVQQPVFSKDVYEKIVSRLVGQYSRVTIESRKNAPEARTVADCIHLTGVRFGRHILRPDQLQILESEDKFVFLTGPPGSGKTLVLGLKATEWARDGNHVVIVQPQGVGWGSLVSWTLYDQVKSALKVDPKKSHAKRADSARKRRTSSKHDAETSSHASPGERSISEVDGRDRSTGNGAEGSSTSSNKRGTDTKMIKDPGHRSAETSLKETETNNTDANNRNTFSLGSTTTDTDGVATGSDDIATKTLCVAAKNEDSTKGNDAATSRSDSTKTDGVAAITRGVSTEADDRGTETGDASERVHRLQISRDTNSEQFVQNLKTQFGGIPIRLIVDECPSKDPPEHLHRFLSGSHNRFQKVKASFLGFGESLKERRSQVKDGSGSDLMDGDAETNAAIKAHIGKIEHLLKGIKDRLAIFQPPHGKPAVTQSEEWKFHVTGIQKTCQDIERHLEEFRTFITDEAKPADSCVTNLQNLKKVLEESTATMLEASGQLFNVETSLGSYAFSDVFLAVRTQLAEQVDISVWSSGVKPSYKPEDFVEKRTSQCIRCPPRVQQVLEQTQVDMMNHPSYTYQCSSIKANVFPLPTDGPEVKLLDHSGHMTKVKDINDCSDCGEAMADYIQQTLRDGCDSGLRLEDIVISGSFDLSGNRCEFLEALRRRGVAMEFETDSLTSPPPYEGKAFVIGGSAVQGLEAKIVVFIPDVSRIPMASEDPEGKQFRAELPPWLRGLGRWNRCHLWFVASRCLSQLVVFHV